MEMLPQTYMQSLHIGINIFTLLHVTHITAKREFHTVKLFVLIESVQTLILLIEDVMVLESG